MEKERIYYWDNLKALLIFLVVLGHYLIPVSREGRSVETVYFFVYLFHMPAFVFVSGYFSKYYMKKEVPQVNKLMGFLLLFLVYKVLLWAVNSALAGELKDFHLLEEDAAPWYLLCMFLWYIFLPFLAKFKPAVSIMFAVCLGIIAGLNPAVGPFLCFSRFAVFLPFFLAGYYCREDLPAKITTVKVRAGAAIFLVVTAVLIFLNLDFMDQYETIIYGSHSYAVMDVPSGNAMIMRFVWYIVAMAMTLAVMCLIPKRKTIVSYIGSRTLAIYIIHRVLRPIILQTGVYEYFMGSGISILLFCGIVSLVITFICSGKHLTAFFQKAFQVRWDRLLIKKEKENI